MIRVYGSSSIILSSRYLQGRFIASKTVSLTSGKLDLYCWGTNQSGSLPSKDVLKTGRSEDSANSAESLIKRARQGAVADIPLAIDLDDAFGDHNPSIRDVVCGPTSTAVITDENTAFVFGINKSGQLGTGDREDVLIPTSMSPPHSSSLHHNQISTISLGNHFSAIIDTNGDLYTMGYNGSVLEEGVGCLGLGSDPESYVTVPSLVESLVEDGCKAIQVGVGDYHMTVLTDDGEVLSCGSGMHGKCGNIESTDQVFLEPVELLASETDIHQIAVGKDFSLALTKGDGIIFAWGRNHKGQCGTGSGLSVEMYAMEPMPVPVEGMLEGRHVTKVAAGRSHAAALTDKGELFTWGLGQTFLPTPVNFYGRSKIVDLACGDEYTVVLDDEGKLFSFGKGKTGVLGLASQTKVVEPTLIEGMQGENVTKISTGWKHVACLAHEVEND